MIVYWSPYRENNQVFSEFSYLEPVRMLDIVMSEQTQSPDAIEKNRYKNCPAFRDYWHNVYGLRFTHDYAFEIDGDEIKSKNYDQKFFDSFVFVRSVKDRLLSIRNTYLFFAESSLEISSFHAHFEDTAFCNSVRVIPGTFDIGQWARPLECAFFVKNGAKNIEVKAGQIFCYVKFHTSEPVVLERFNLTQQMYSIIDQALALRNYKKLSKSLSYFYERFTKSRWRKFFLKEIKKQMED